MKIYILGICGTFMAGIAMLAREMGHEVLGSDAAVYPPMSDQLAAAGIELRDGYSADNLDLDADLYIIGNALSRGNEQVEIILERGLDYISGPQWLSEHLLRERWVLAVAGTHGKTTTASLLAWILEQAGLQPGFLIGGLTRNFGISARLGAAPFFVIEADEYDHMFLGLTPYAAIVTNIEHDHPDMFPTAEDFYEAFRRFARQVREDGFLLACADHAGSRRLAADHEGTALTYGLQSDDADYQAVDVRLNARGGYDFAFLPTAGAPVPVSLAVPGRHNVANALAVLAVVHRLGLDVPAAVKALAGFRSTGRRFEVVGEAGGVVFVDDYAHHPTEIRATLAAARERFPGHAVWAVWQPHTYSRTLTLLPQFAGAFDDADAVVVTDVFAAREAPPEGFDPREVAAALQHPQVHFAATLEAAAEVLLTQVQPPAVVVVLSAGDAPAVTRWALEGWQKR